MLRIYLTGDLCLTRGHTLIKAERLPRRQGRLVFAYLVSERGRQVSKDELADSLWPQRLPKAFDAGVSAIVSKLRSLFEEIGIGRQSLTAASGCYQLRLPPDAWIDVEAALESVHVAEAGLLAARPRNAYGPAVVACAILRRPFLLGEEGTWVESRRESLRKARLRALDCLAEIHTSTGEHALALRAAEEAIELEPFREAGYRRLMLIHEASGNPAEALRLYVKLKALLEAEVGSGPGPETRRLFQAVAERAALLPDRL
jgi:DNA-binding SARP family transcriptional activator